MLYPPPSVSRITASFPRTAVWDEMPTPLGILKIIASEEGLHALLWEHESMGSLPRSQEQAVIAETRRELSEYFRGIRLRFDVPVRLKGTSFEMQAWQALRDIPYGQTLSYGEQAKRIGDKNKARAVGRANGHNPVPILIPCHRVIHSNGHLSGFGGGSDKKAWLLEHEKNTLQKIGGLISPPLKREGG